jgi:carbon storage regulator
MLVLSRKKNEKICIGKDIVIHIVSVGSDRAQIGIEAPRELPVHRGEVFEKITKEKAGAAATDAAIAVQR